MSTSTINAPILVVDDERVIRMLLSMVIQEYGYLVQAVDSITAAKKCLEQCLYRGLVLDYQISSGNGLTFLRDLRKSGFHLPTVIVSGHDITAIKQEAADISVQGFLMKPFELADLRTIIGQVFGAVEPQSIQPPRLLRRFFTHSDYKNHHYNVFE